MNKTITISVLAFIALFIGLVLIEKISANREAHVRIAYNLGEHFFDYVDKTIKEHDIHEKNFKDHLPHPVAEWIDVEDFSSISDPLFKIDVYRIHKRRDETYLIYRGEMPPLGIESNETLRLISYDVTNGTYSEGYQARIVNK